MTEIEDVDKALWAGPGARWAIMDPFLTFHLGGRPGGLKYHIDTIQQSLRVLEEYGRLEGDTLSRCEEGYRGCGAPTHCQGEDLPRHGEMERRQPSEDIEDPRRRGAIIDEHALYRALKSGKKLKRLANA